MAKKITVSARVPAKDDAPEMVGSVDIEVGETAAESIQLFGDEPVNTNMIANASVTVQGGIRGGLRKGLSMTQIQEKYAGWKLGIAAVGGKVDPQQLFIQRFATATPEEQADMIKKLREAAKNK